MGYPWPKAPREDGSGTTPTDLQRIIGSQYVSSGLLPNGGGRTSGTSSMAYDVEPGAGFMWTSYAARLGMLVPFEATTVQTDPAPATGSRTDTIYVDGEGAVRVAIGSRSIPSGVAIARWTVPAGITATTAASESIDRNFAIPAGASLGLLHRFHDPAADGTIGNVSPMTLGRGRFNLPSDRIVRLDLVHCMGSTMEDDATASVIRWRIYIDDYLQGAFVSRSEFGWPQTQFLSFSKTLSEGPHTIHYVQDLQGGARFVHRNDTSNGYLGNRFEIWDAGVSR